MLAIFFKNFCPRRELESELFFLCLRKKCYQYFVIMTVDMDLLREYDSEQAKLMEEVCIVVDEDDNAAYPSQSKKVCHLMENINKGLLHRAFSVFLFSSDGKLLLQQRADEKITFPGYWTNTCCSHPLAIPDELVEEDNVGVKRAAIRKLEQELGIRLTVRDISKFIFLTRIHYLAPSDNQKLWGEHEIDYILFIKADVTLNVNPNEVKDVKYVTPDQLEAIVNDSSLKITPWFKLIVENFIYKWWDALDSNLESFVEPNKIHRLLPETLPWTIQKSSPLVAASLDYS